MKASTTELIKFLKLQRRLGDTKRGVTGLLELLWLATARQAPRGDIGRHTNEDIAILCDWEGDPDTLIETLVETGWLDQCAVNRLVIHDWKDHAPNYVRAALQKRGVSFAISVAVPSGDASGDASGECSPERSGDASGDGSPEVTPSQAKPSQTKLNQETPLPPTVVNGGSKPANHNAGGDVRGMNRPGLKDLIVPTELAPLTADVDRWVEYLWSRDGKLNPITINAHLVSMAQHGTEKSREAITIAIERGYAAPAWGNGTQASDAAPKKFQPIRRRGAEVSNDTNRI